MTTLPTTSYFQEMIESVESLSIEDQDYLFDLIRKRRIHKNRLQIAKDGEEIIKQLAMGTAKKGTVDDLIADLFAENDDESNLE